MCACTCVYVYDLLVQLLYVVQSCWFFFFVLLCILTFMQNLIAIPQLWLYSLLVLFCFFFRIVISYYFAVDVVLFAFLFWIYCIVLHHVVLFKLITRLNIWILIITYLDFKFFFNLFVLFYLQYQLTIIVIFFLNLWIFSDTFLFVYPTGDERVCGTSEWVEALSERRPPAMEHCRQVSYGQKVWCAKVRRSALYCVWVSSCCLSPPPPSLHLRPVLVFPHSLSNVISGSLLTLQLDHSVKHNPFEKWFCF